MRIERSRRPPVKAGASSSVDRPSHSVQPSMLIDATAESGWPCKNCSRPAVVMDYTRPARVT